jgi:hypothetical protein
MGGEYRRIQYNNIANDSASGIFNFATSETAAGSSGILAPQGGFAFASLLLGQMYSANLMLYPHTRSLIPTTTVSSCRMISG